MKLHPAIQPFRSMFVAAVVLAAAAGLRAEATTDQIIALARTYLGGDAALDAVKSVRYVGSIHMPDGRVGDIEILVRKPMCQRMTITLDNQREITALSGYDGWRRIERLNDPTNWELVLLEAPQIRQLRANTWENIGFYRGIESIGGRVEQRGELEIEGLKCAKLAFIHSPTIQFVRCFDVQTGRLVLTQTDDGQAIRESGEIVVSGVRFPKELTTTAKEGKRIIAFSRVQVNEEFPDNLFDVPLLKPRSKP